MGISLRRFDGWEPAEETTYEYDGDGRLVRSVTTRETEWTEEEQDWMLALSEYRASLCPCGCGHPLRETAAQEGTHEWTVPPPVRCLARDALSIAQNTAQRDRPEALLWRVERRR